MDGYLLCTLDVGGTADPAAIAVAHVFRRDGLTKSRILHLGVKPPVITPQAHVDWVQEVMINVMEKVGRGPTRYGVDLSNNSAIAFLLAQQLPRNSLIGVKISGGDQHSAGVTAHLIGDVGGRSTALPTLTLSRRQLLLDLTPAFTNGILSLPLEDPEQCESVATLKTQMARASLKVTPSGKTVAVVQRSHDDLLMAVAMLHAVTRLPPPHEPRLRREHREPASSLGWT
ncbi:hypothetical protein [Rhizobium sp. RAF56]|uniref:hypothetical protein n=1 Tax=Rhizobium sp. RAF56 TaxID=3233062 RepID=UPI003F9854ED